MGLRNRFVVSLYLEKNMQLAIAIIDAFTNNTFQGNPAATVLVEQFPEDAQMQQIAAEMNLSETAFVMPLASNNHFQLRWFTPCYPCNRPLSPRTIGDKYRRATYLFNIKR
jgi:PhzF family phenazine biosynthesis protein